MKNLSIFFTAIFLTATFSTAIIGQDFEWDQYGGKSEFNIPAASGWNHGSVYCCYSYNV